MSVLVILESGHKLSLETVRGGQYLSESLGLPLTAVDPRNLHASCVEYTADAYTQALAGYISEAKPKYVLLPHTYRSRDFAPKLATRFGKALLSDVTQIRCENGQAIVSRQLFQGKLTMDVLPKGEPVFVSLQAGSFAPAAQLPEPASFAASVDSAAVRQKPEAAFRESQRAVDLSVAPYIVSVGRGIQEQENLKIVEDLAAALGAELGASRPICDNGWLPMERQVGSSGQTVAPKLYVAVGLSGAIQHLVGMKGAKTVVAINKDPHAPIFEVADYGICGDLFEVVPKLTEAIRRAKQ
jgi:electron transfer flavoprotein alpha subunit